MSARRDCVFIAWIALAASKALAQPSANAPPQTPPDADFGTIELFNGRNFDGLRVHVQDPEVKPADICRVEEGMLRITGVGRGYIRTTTAFADYKLTFEWRWPGAGGNSGLILHVVNPDILWPKGFEVQLAAGRAGDFFSYSDARSNEELVSRNPTGYSTGRLPRSGPSDVEKPLGEWNKCEIIAIGGAVTVSINGRQVNRMTGVVPNAGMIALQAEGAAIDFRKIVLTVLPPAKHLHAPMPKP
jgi:hypothetical protein